MDPISPTHVAGLRQLIRKRGVKKLLLGGGIALSILITSCMTMNGPVMNIPNSVPGATFVGSEECSLCHDNVTGNFHSASHARLGLRSEEGLDLSCEACHGPGSLHAENGGEIPGQIVNPGKNPESCFQCHLDKRGEFHLPSAHPVLEGKISCTDCHNPHEGPAVMGGGTALMSENQTCFQCHDAQKGPHVFEHEALRDGCTTCHTVHGSVNAKLLKVRNANLCLQCHMLEPASGGSVLIGGREHSSFLGRGTCWSAGCHEAIHGSNINSHLRY
ncbi:cytochrome c3 family protein [Coraliomargarita parva]|uniref:cytochrome c3 family protein n=1 Tax=Coraliomargarita parva TaxID=3014050 RepID=UPI0022B4475F|nr:cytochrome c3 family protein [Coraliomargarita parva]